MDLALLTPVNIILQRGIPVASHTVSCSDAFVPVNDDSPTAVDTGGSQTQLPWIVTGGCCGPSYNGLVHIHGGH